MKSKELIIFGISDFAKQMMYYFSIDSGYKVIAFCVDNKYLPESGEFLTLPVISIDNLMNDYRRDEVNLFLAIGYRNMRMRKQLFDRLHSAGFKMVNYISSKAIFYSNLEIGANNVILGGVNIEPFVKIGDNNIIWSNTLIGHDTIIENHNYISACCLIGGQSVIKDLCFIGNGVVTINDITIRDETYVVCGGVLLNSTRAANRYEGNPARSISNHKDQGILIN